MEGEAASGGAQGTSKPGMEGGFHVKSDGDPLEHL